MAGAWKEHLYTGDVNYRSQPGTASIPEGQICLDVQHRYRQSPFGESHVQQCQCQGDVFRASTEFACATTSLLMYNSMDSDARPSTPAGPSAESMGNSVIGDTSSHGSSPAHETQMSWETENATMQEGGSPASSRRASPVQLSSDSRKVTDMYVGLRNQGSTCYLNSLLQCLFFTQELREAILSCDNSDFGIVCQLKKLFQELKRNKSEPSTKEITKCLGVRNVHQQQDVAEYFRILMNKIVEEKEEIQPLYQVKMVHSITCHGCEQETRIQQDPVLSLALSLDKYTSNQEVYSVHNALADVQKVNEFTGDEQFYCETCKSKQEATSRCYFETLPPILVLNLKRYQFDGNWFTKLHYKVSVPFSLTVNSEKQPNTQYELFAMCHHFGGIHGGHYVAEIRPFENKCWYSFNDTMVTKNTEEWNTTGATNSSTAYLLMYRMANCVAKPKPAPTAPANLVQEAQPEPEIQPSASEESSSQSTETLLSSESLPVGPSQSAQPCKELMSPASGKQFQAEQETDESRKGACMMAQSDLSPLSSSNTSSFVVDGGFLSEGLPVWCEATEFGLRAAMVTMNDINLLRITKSDKEWMLSACQQTPGPYATMLCYAMIPDYVLLAWRGKVSYHGGRDKAALPRNLLQRLWEYMKESFLEMSLEDFRSIPIHINRLFQ